MANHKIQDIRDRLRLISSDLGLLKLDHDGEEDIFLSLELARDGVDDARAHLGLAVKGVGA